MHWSSLPSPGVLLNVPSLHGSGADALFSQYEPAVHSTHAVAPCPCWYLPASHFLQALCSIDGCTVPGLHLLGAAAPVEQKAPAGHAKQSSSLVIERLSADMVPFWWRPDGHGRGEEEPSKQYEPDVQARHSV